LVSRRPDVLTAAAYRFISAAYSLELSALSGVAGLGSGAPPTGTTSPSAFLPSRSCCTSSLLKRQCSTAKLSPAMLTEARISLGCTCVGPAEHYPPVGIRPTCVQRP